LQAVIRGLGATSLRWKRQGSILLIHTCLAAGDVRSTTGVGFGEMEQIAWDLIDERLHHGMQILLQKALSFVACGTWGCSPQLKDLHHTLLHICRRLGD